MAHFQKAIALTYKTATNGVKVWGALPGLQSNLAGLSMCNFEGMKDAGEKGLIGFFFSPQFQGAAEARQYMAVQFL